MSQDVLLSRFPLLAALAGGVVWIAYLVVVDGPAGDPAIGFTLGVGVFSALLALRSWFVAHRLSDDLCADRAALTEDQLLITEELLELDERLDLRAAEAEDLRALVAELTSIVEESVAGGGWDDSTGRGAAAARIALTAAVERAEALETRMAAQEERARKLAQAVRLAVTASREAQARLEALERDDGRRAAPASEAAATPPEPEPEPERPAEILAFQARGAASSARSAEDSAPLFLQPICNLASGEAVLFDAYAEAETAADAAVDAALLERSVAVADELRRGERDLRVLCDLTPSRLRDADVLAALGVGRAAESDGCERVIVEFTQAAIADLDDADRDALRAAADHGAAFSLDGVTDWSLDLAELGRLGFRYLKLDSVEFLRRVRASGGDASRLVDQLARCGLELIVSGIDDEDAMSEVAAAGAGLGQGRAVAEPRALRVA